MENKFLYVIIMLASGSVISIYSTKYTITNVNNYKLPVKVTLQESFKDPETKILKPGDVWEKDTYLANCLDYVQVEAVNENGDVIAPFPYKQAPVCAGSATVCIVNGPGYQNGKKPDRVEVYQAFSGLSAQDCARGRQ